MNKTTESPSYNRMRQPERNTTFPNAFHRRDQSRQENLDGNTSVPKNPAFHQRRENTDGQERPNVFGSSRTHASQRPHSSYQQSYQGWKRNEDPMKPKEVNISSITDFPSLSNDESTKTTIKLNPAVSLADKLKVTIQREAEESTRRHYQKEFERPDEMIVIPLSTGSFLRNRAQARKAQEEERRQMNEEAEHYYNSNVNEEEFDDNDDEYNHNHSHDNMHENNIHDNLDHES